MTSRTCAGRWALVAALVLTPLFWSPSDMRVRAQSATTGPQFEVDPSWPKQLPERWVTGELGGVCVDANDHVFVLSRANLYPGIDGDRASRRRPVMEFDQTGNVVNSWGNRDVMAEALHGCSFDAEGNIWIAGNGDGFIQKYSHDGKLLLQIGVKGKVDSEGRHAEIPLPEREPGRVLFADPGRRGSRRTATCSSPTATATSASRSSTRPASSCGSGGVRARRPKPPPGWAARS